MGSEYGDAYGVGGLGMLGSGAGAGDPNTSGSADGDGSARYGYGLADVGSMGHGYGSADGVGAGGSAMGRAAPDLRGSATPELRLGEATTYGGLSKEVIRRVVAQHRGRVRHCYETALLGDPAAAGRVTVKFVIAPEGRVQSGEVASNTTGDDTLGQCILEVVRQMQFPESDGIIVVSYPFQLLSSELLVVAAADPTSSPPPTQGTLRAQDPDGSLLGDFPLRRTEVSAQISGYLAQTVVEQTYENPYTRTIEAVYVFPLPSLGAVNDFVMEVGDHKIVGIVRPREEAERIYRDARARGQTASLLSQERPNIFTESVANIEPGGEVKIRLTYFERLEYERGGYEWVFPMVVGPRYIPGVPESQADDDSGPTANSQQPTAPSGRGWAEPTDQVPDADRITPPVLPPGLRSGHDIALTVTVDAGLPIHNLDSVNHEVEIEEPSDVRHVVKLAAADSVPNRDFVLRWKVDGAETQFGVLAHKDDAGGFLTLMMQPPLAPDDDQVTPREITFILDVSGSMMGLPVDTSKAVVTRALDHLRPDDRFNIFLYASGDAQLWSTPRRGTAENLAEAREFLRRLEGSGGTEMLPGLRRALQAEHDAKVLQMYVLLTDGFVGNEDAILQAVRSERGEARFFAFGIGGSVNRYLIDGIGEFGGGAAEVVLPRDEGHAEQAARRMFELIDSPVLVDVSIDWNGLPVADVYPSKLPDLFAGQTIALVARYTAAASGTAYVEARVGSQHVRLPVAVELPGTAEDNAALAPLWARWRIEDLAEEMMTADAAAKEELEQQVTDLAVEFRLVSAYTSFVAVDESRTVGNGDPTLVAQPVEMPEGVSYEGVFGEEQ
jgi:Ca-activated chloride channel family protein